MSVPQATASTTFYQLLANHDRVLDAATAGSEVLTWTVTGREQDGTPFSLSTVDRFASDVDITFEAVWEVSDFVSALASIRGVTIDDVTMDSAVDDDSSTWVVGQVEQRRAGEWLRVTRRSPALARAGRELKLRAVLVSGRDTRAVPLTLTVPRKAAGSMAEVAVVGASSIWSEDEALPRSIGDAERLVRDHVRNDQLLVDFTAFGRGGGIRKVTESAAQDKVVIGGKNVRVLVR